MLHLIIREEQFGADDAGSVHDEASD